MENNLEKRRFEVDKNEGEILQLFEQDSYNVQNLIEKTWKSGHENSVFILICKKFPKLKEKVLGYLRRK